MLGLLVEWLQVDVYQAIATAEQIGLQTRSCFLPSLSLLKITTGVSLRHSNPAQHVYEYHDYETRRASLVDLRLLRAPTIEADESTPSSSQAEADPPYSTDDDLTEEFDPTSDDAPSCDEPMSEADLYLDGLASFPDPDAVALFYHTIQERREMSGTVCALVLEVELTHEHASGDVQAEIEHWALKCGKPGGVVHGHVLGMRRQPYRWDE